MDQSILTSIKKLLGIEESYTEFDVDIIMHINSVLAVLQQLGVGPIEGLMISDNTTTWNALLSDSTRLNMVKSYMFLKVRVLFDPPATSFVLTSMEQQAKELEWRLNVVRENEISGVVIYNG